MAKHAGDPTPASPRAVLSDRRYRFVNSQQVVALAGRLLNTLVVLHCGTETYWETTYEVSRDGDGRAWEQVVPVTETRVVYRRKA